MPVRPSPRGLLLALPLTLAVLVGAGVAPRAAVAAPSAARAAALAQRLATTRLKNVVWKDLALKDVVTWLRTATGINFFVNQAALAKENIDASALSFTVELADVSVQSLLSVLLEPHGMAVRLHDNIVFLTTKADSYGRLVTRVYGVSHITWQKIDFIAPDIHLNPSGATGDDYEPEVVRDDDPLTTGDAVAEVLKEIVSPGEWGTEGWNIRSTRQYLVIRAPLSVHARIPRALDVIASMK